MSEHNNENLNLHEGLNLDDDDLENMLKNPNLFTTSPGIDVESIPSATNQNSVNGQDDKSGIKSQNSDTNEVIEDIVNPSIDPYVSTPHNDEMASPEDDIDSINNKDSNKLMTSLVRQNYGPHLGRDNADINSSNFRSHYQNLFDDNYLKTDMGSPVNKNKRKREDDDDDQLYSSQILRGPLSPGGNAHKVDNRLMSYGSNNLNSRQQTPGMENTPSVLNRRFQNKTRPAFVNKVWSMINDPVNSHLIQWSEDGLSLIVVNREKFVHEILPKYFKHSNFASFVRQLNMYGWHKVQDVKSGSIQSSSDDRWQFENEFFVRGREDLLNRIVRQKGTSANATPGTQSNMKYGNGNQIRGLPNVNGQTLRLMNEANMGNTMDITAVLGELEQIKFNQMAISKDLMRINKDNELLWKENMIARERHRTQQQALEKIFRFLRNVVPHADQKLLMDVAEPVSSRIEEAQDISDAPSVSSKSFDFDDGKEDRSRYIPLQDEDGKRPLYLLKNRTMSENSNKSSGGRLASTHNDSSGRISEIPFEEDDLSPLAMK